MMNGYRYIIKLINEKDSFKNNNKLHHFIKDRVFNIIDEKYDVYSVFPSPDRANNYYIDCARTIMGKVDGCKIKVDGLLCEYKNCSSIFRDQY